MKLQKQLQQALFKAISGLFFYKIRAIRISYGNLISLIFSKSNIYNIQIFFLILALFHKQCLIINYWTFEITARKNNNLLLYHTALKYTISYSLISLFKDLYCSQATRVYTFQMNFSKNSIMISPLMISYTFTYALINSLS